MKQSQWIEEFLLPLGAAGLTVAWLNVWTRWLASLAPQPAPWLSPGLMLGLMAVSAAAARLAARGWGTGPTSDDSRRWIRDPGVRARQIVLSTGLLATVGALWLTYGARFPLEYGAGLFDWGHFISPEFVMLLACGLLWWRGIVLGQSRLPYDTLETTFYNGLAALALLLLIHPQRPTLPGQTLLVTILSYFALGLSLLTLASFERARRQHRGASGTHLVLTRHWMGTVVGIIASVLAGGLAVIALLAPASLARLQPLFAVLDVLARPVVFALAVVIGWFVRPLFEVANWLARVGFSLLKLPELPPQLQVNETTMKVMDAILQSRFVQVSSRGLIMLIILAVMLALIAGALRRFRWLTEPEAEETRENIWSRDLLWQQLQRWRPRPPAPAALPPYMSVPGPDPRSRIRRAYQGMLEWAKREGMERPAGQTPVQYAAALHPSQPAAGEAVTVLTAAYQRARYSATSLETSEASTAEDALKKISVKPEA